MKRLIKRIVKRCISFFLKLCRTIKVLFFLPLKTDLKNHIPKIEGAQLLTILANGPSLKKDIEKINLLNGDFCVVNDFYKSPYYSIIKPKYHVLADPLYFTQNSDIEPFIQSVNWELKMFVPYFAWKKMDLLRGMPNEFITVIPFHNKISDSFQMLDFFLYRKGVSIPGTPNVLVPSIFNGINMGYNEIHLYGADHSWTENIRVNNENQVCLKDSHFYDKEKVSLKPWRKSMEGRDVYKMYEILRDLANTFEAYHILREYADTQGCHIVNKTGGSYIDAFDRV